MKKRLIIKKIVRSSPERKSTSPPSLTRFRHSGHQQSCTMRAVSSSSHALREEEVEEVGRRSAGWFVGLDGAGLVADGGRSRLAGAWHGCVGVGGVCVVCVYLCLWCVVLGHMCAVRHVSLLMLAVCCQSSVVCCHSSCSAAAVLFSVVASCCLLLLFFCWSSKSLRMPFFFLAACMLRFCGLLLACFLGRARDGDEMREREREKRKEV